MLHWLYTLKWLEQINKSQRIENYPVLMCFSKSQIIGLVFNIKKKYCYSINKHEINAVYQFEQNERRKNIWKDLEYLL